MNTTASPNESKHVGVESWEVLTGRGYFWFRDGFDDFTSAPLSQKCHLGSEAAAMKGDTKRAWHQRC